MNRRPKPFQGSALPAELPHRHGPCRAFGWRLCPATLGQARRSVNLSSVAGRGVYNATKWAVGAFSEALRQEVYKDHIRVTVIEPGAVDTELTEHITNPAAKKETQQWYESIRQLKSEDIAAAIVYAITQPPYVHVNEILIRPTDQAR